MKKLLIKVLIYPLIGLCATLVFTLLFLPTDTISQMLVQRIENGLDSKYEVKIDSLNLSLFGTLTLEKLQFTPRLSSASDSSDLIARIDADRRPPSDLTASDADGSDASSAPTPQTNPEHRDDRCPTDLTAASLIRTRPTFIKKIELSPSITQLLGGGFDSPLSIQMAGGTADLHIVHHAEHGTKISGDIANIQLQQFHLLSQMALEKMPMFKLRGIAASFSASLDLIAPKGASFDSGSISLDIKNLALCLPELNMKGSPPIPLPDLRLGDMSGSIEFAKDKRIAFKNLSSDGEDGSIIVSGFIDLPSLPKRPKSRWDLSIKLRFSDAYIEAGDLSGLDNICPPNAEGFREIIIRGTEGERGYQAGCNKKPSSSPDKIKPPRDDADPTSTLQNPSKLPAKNPNPPAKDVAPVDDPPKTSEVTEEEVPMAAPTNPALLEQRGVTLDGVRVGSNPVAVSPQRSRQMLNAINGGPRKAPGANPADLTPQQRSKMRRALDDGKLSPSDTNLDPEPSSLSDKQERFRGNLQ
jgi:type II secretion system protein N